MNRPSYYAVIPADVRYADIPANAKLLYGEITALCNEKGICWANNSYFGKLYGVSNRSIQAWLKMLTDSGFIYVTQSDSGKRLITHACAKASRGEKKTSWGVNKTSWGYEENFTGGGEENFTHNNTKVNITENNPPPYSPPPSPQRKDIGGDGFAELWACWKPFEMPKGGKPEAAKAYAKALRETTHNEILAGAEAYLSDCHKLGTKTKHVSTWLNQKGWQHEPADENDWTASKRRGSGKKSTSDWIREAVADIAPE